MSVNPFGTAIGVAGTGTTFATSFPSSSVSGDLLLLTVWSSNRTTTDVPTVSGGGLTWTQLITAFGGDTAAVGAGTGGRRVTVFYAEHDGVSTAPTVTVAGTATGRVTNWMMQRFTKSGSDPYRLQAVSGQDSTLDNTIAITGSSTLRYKQGDVAVAMMAGSDSASTSATLSLGSTALGSPNSESRDAATTSGDDLLQWQGHWSITDGSIVGNAQTPSLGGSQVGTVTGLVGVIVRITDFPNDNLGRLIGRVSEVGTSVPIAGIIKSRTLGIVTEADVALTMTPVLTPQGIAVNTVTETDTAQPVGRVKLKAINPATETDSAVALSRVKVKAISVVTEVDEALVIGVNTIIPVNAATSAEEALAFGRLKRYTIGTAAEINEAQPIQRLIYRFEPPTYRVLVGRSTFSRGPRIPMSVGISIVRINGTLTEIDSPTGSQLVAAGTEGEDWFLGGHVYTITPTTASELQAAGYSVTTE